MYQMAKRLVDFTTSLLMLIVLLPLLAVTAGVIALTMGTPVLFRQQRPGLGGRLFTLYKFRTMRDARRSDGTTLPDDERLTRIGRFLRSTSVDELPELYNVLKGDMSLVGPRPLLVEYLPLYTPEQARRHDVAPGITGWAQVNGRNALTWEKKFELDVWYVDHRSLALDARILLITLLKVVRREGISQVGEATMKAFTGTADSTVNAD
jgi:lipopolysaccharide/colanic/teichoic acid biosynthesis glycosyltransferase